MHASYQPSVLAPELGLTRELVDPDGDDVDDDDDHESDPSKAAAAGAGKAQGSERRRGRGARIEVVCEGIEQNRTHQEEHQQRQTAAARVQQGSECASLSSHHLSSLVH